MLKVQYLSLSNKIFRSIWNFVWLFFYRPTPRIFHFWRCFLLRLFGAKLGKSVRLYPTARIWAPWNLEMGDNSCLSEWVDCYCVDKIFIGANTTVSQYSFLCTASHDYKNIKMNLVTSPIIIGDYVWITADVFIGPGVIIGDGAVITARSSIFEDVAAWTIVSLIPTASSKSRYLDGFNSN